MPREWKGLGPNWEVLKMGLVSTALGFFGFGAGLTAGVVVGYYIFIRFQPSDVKVPAAGLTLYSVMYDLLSGMKVYITEEKELTLEPSLKWAGNPNVIIVIKAYGLRLTIQVINICLILDTSGFGACELVQLYMTAEGEFEVVDLQIFAAPRITLKPLVPSFPCFAKIYNAILFQEILGYVTISLADVVNNKRTNSTYHLIDSNNGQIQIEILWKTS
ncbi:hypothetical protein BHE74_00024007 [Ensete ventricosum]|nr:hypothetical protein GW17_00044255 [Ensete ventricosum]RWW68464.1 hypothetical protein BHE74_00024007 [Ensete ventricosum]